MSFLQAHTLTDMLGERVLMIRRIKRQGVYYGLPIIDHWPILSIMMFGSDNPEEWDFFMRTVDELFQSAPADLGMYVDEVYSSSLASDTS